MRNSELIDYISDGVTIGLVKRVVTPVAALMILSMFVTNSLSGQEGCNRLWQAREPSPDSVWVALVHQDVCDVGLGSAVDIIVELQARDSVKTRKIILSPSGQWKNPDAVRLKWLNRRLLEISVPNRTVFSNPVSQYRGVAICIKYRHDNPADRARWMTWVKENMEWVKSSDGRPQPASPPLPDSDQAGSP